MCVNGGYLLSICSSLHHQKGDPHTGTLLDPTRVPVGAWSWFFPLVACWGLGLRFRKAPGDICNCKRCYVNKI